MPNDSELPSGGENQTAENLTMPQPGAEVTPITPQIRQNEGAMAHESHGYSVKAPSEETVSVPVRVEDPEKARVMADAEAPDRDDAAELRNQAAVLSEANGAADYEFADDLARDADMVDGVAEKAGEEAGRQYDAEHAAEKGVYITQETFDKVSRALADAQQLLEDSRSGKLREQAESEP